jgi:hypothetical protein
MQLLYAIFAPLYAIFAPLYAIFAPLCAIFTPRFTVLITNEQSLDIVGLSINNFNGK